MKKYEILFFDLDGTLIETASGKTFPESLMDFKFKTDVLDKIVEIINGYGSEDMVRCVQIVSNQGGVELGHVSGYHMECKMGYITACMEEYIEKRVSWMEKGSFDVGYDFCMSNSKSHQKRKPNTGMLEDYLERLIGNEDNGYAMDKLKDLCLMVGDASGLPGQFSDSDKRCAESFGIDYMDVSEFISHDFGKE